MTKQEILCTPIGEMLDMVSCLSVYEGSATVKKPKMTMEEFLMLK